MLVRIGRYRSSPGHLGGLLGVTASVDATLAAQDGRLIVQPDVPFGGLATLTVFSDPHLEVQGVEARIAAGGFSVTAFGRVR